MVMTLDQTAQIDSPSLVVEGGPDHDKVIALTDQVSLGRLPTNDVVVSDRCVSRKHAVIIKTEGGFCVRDLSSSNGTFVNSKSIAVDDHPLKDGDRVLLGVSETALVFRTPESATLKLTAVQQAVGRAAPQGTMVVEVPDLPARGGGPREYGEEAQLHEGDVRFNVKAEGGLGLVVQLTEHLLEQPEFRMLRLGNSDTSEVDVWLVLREPVPLKRILREVPGVVEAEFTEVGDTPTFRVLLRGEATFAAP